MSYLIKSIIIALLLAGSLVACAAPATSVSTLVPTPVPVVATATPQIQGDPITIPAGEGDETIKATITGNGNIAIMVYKARYDTDTISRWTPLFDILSTNEKLRILTYTIRDGSATAVKDSRAVFDYLRAGGINRIIPICAGLQIACVSLQNEPEIIGMVMFASEYVMPIEADFPKLFLTSDLDVYSGSLKRVYEQSAEPKVFKSWAADINGPAVFAKADVGPQVVADITDFINDIVSGQ